MNSDYLVKAVEMDCPICEKIHLVEKRCRMTQAVVKDEVVDYEQVYYRCNVSDEKKMSLFLQE